MPEIDRQPPNLCDPSLKPLETDNCNVDPCEVTLTGTVTLIVTVTLLVTLHLAVTITLAVTVTLTGYFAK